MEDFESNSNNDEPFYSNQGGDSGIRSHKNEINKIKKFDPYQ